MDLRYGTTEHSRTLDFRTGTLRRETVWTSPTGRRVRIRSERLVSFTKRAIAAIHYEVEPLSEDMTSCCIRPARQRADPDSGNDPVWRAALDAPLVADLADSHGYWRSWCTTRAQLPVAHGRGHGPHAGDAVGRPDLDPRRR